MKERLKKIKKELEKTVDMLDDRGIYSPIPLLEEAAGLIDDAIEEYNEYLSED